MAKEAKAATGKAPKVKVDEGVIAKMKEELRDKLNGLEPKALTATAKRFGVDIAKYSKLAPGLQRMNLTNSTLGSAARWMRDDGKSAKDVFALVK